MAEAKHTPMDLDALEKVALAAANVAPGCWETDSVDGEDGYGSYKAYAVFAGPDDKPKSIVDTHNSDIACIHIEHDEDGAHRWDEAGRVVCDHIAAFGPPTVLRLIQDLAARGWQPIETAPKDGSVIDLWSFWPEHSVWKRTPDAHWNAAEGEWQLGQYHAGQVMHRPAITHWKPADTGPAIAQLAEGRV